MQAKPDHDNFLSDEIVLKMYRELRNADAQTKINTLIDYAASVKDQFDDDRIQFEIDKQKALIYYDAKDYATALPYLEKVLAAEIPGQRSESWHLYSLLQIRTNRHLQRYKEGLACFQKALKQMEDGDSAFMYLDLLVDYVNICQDAGIDFDALYLPLIDRVVNELGFPAFDLGPLEKILKLEELNKHWNVMLGQLYLQKIAELEKIKGYQDYINTCEIGWYKAYAEKVKARLETKA